MSRLLGALIAGGRSSRFGSDKALALWHGKPLIEHAAEALRPHVDAVIICGRAHGRLTVVADRPGPNMGPLGGLSGALHHARLYGYDAVLTIGCDTPLLPDELAEQLLAEPGPSCVWNLPVIGHWPTDLLDRLDAFLARDQKHAVRGWAIEVEARRIDYPDLPNVNEPADLDRLMTGKTGMIDQK